MTLNQAVIAQAFGKIPRANDPATGLPWPELTMKQKIVAWFWEREGRKLAVKLSAMIVPFVAIICGKIGVTPSATEAIGIGLCALVPQLLDWVISRVGRRMGLSLMPITKMIEEAEADRYAEDNKLIDIREAPTQIAIPRIPRDLPNRAGANPIFSKLASLEEPEQKDVVPAGFYVAGITDAGSRYEHRKYFPSQAAAQAYIDRAAEIYEKSGEEAEARLYFPGNKLPLNKQYD